MLCTACAWGERNTALAGLSSTPAAPPVAAEANEWKPTALYTSSVAAFSAMRRRASRSARWRARA